LTDTEATAAATAAVEGYLRRPLSLVVGQAVTLYTYEDGVVLLGMRPVVRVQSVRNLAGADVPYQLNGARILGLPRELWVTVVYDHGWDVGAVPAAATSVIRILAVRLQSNPAGVHKEGIGGYSVQFFQAGMLLSPDEKAMLAPLRSGFLGAGTLSTREPVSPLLPDVDQFSGGGFAADEWP